MRKRIERDIDILIGCKMFVTVQPVEKMHPLACYAGRGKNALYALLLRSISTRISSF
jgi:hypothetical protein